MRVVVIGGTGHIGTYLVPRLVEARHDVVCVSRRQRAPYQPSDAWAAVTHVVLDRDVEEARGSFGDRIAELQAQTVVDLTCYRLDSAVQLVHALRGHGVHLLHCGTIWVHGPSVAVPTTEDEPRRPFGEYGVRKAAIEAFLLTQSADGVPATVLHPGHLVGVGWIPINPAGNFNPAVFAALADGDEVTLAHLGLETLHHVHADDVAQGFVRAIARPAVAVGESFHLVAPTALTCRGYAERLAVWFGREARVRFLPWEDWRHGVSARDAAVTWDHLSHSPHCSIEKARSRLGYAPRYNPLDAIQESMIWLMAAGVIRRAADAASAGEGTT